MASAILADNLRILRRRQCLTDCNFPSRPSILDSNFRGDIWIAFQDPDFLTLFHGKQRLVTFAGTRMDCVALNSRLFELRQAKPRKKCRR
ncbi:MAG TPA: hypothetical protein VKE98_04330 [Gemmataceae bacterium]|nr:hypothetical protein [Gemmataceae bacterium]